MCNFPEQFVKSWNAFREQKFEIINKLLLMLGLNQKGPLNLTSNK